MDLSDTAWASGAPLASRAPEHAAGALAGRLGEEVAAPLSAALERVAQLGRDGRIDAGALRALREAIERAQRIGVMAQQFSRFAAGRVRQVPERVNLLHALAGALRDRAPQSAALGVQVRQLAPAAVQADPALLYALVQAALEWGFEHARSALAFEIDVHGWPEQARLTLAFDHRDADTVDADAPFDEGAGSPLDSVAWQLLRQTADTLGLQAQRQDSATRTAARLEFATRITLRAPTLADPDVDCPEHTRPPTGQRVVLALAGREPAQAAASLLRRLGLIVVLAESPEQAWVACGDTGRPHALVIDRSLAGYDALRRRLLAEAPALPLLTVEEQPCTIHLHRQGAELQLQVGRAALLAALPSALGCALRGSA